MLTANLLSFQNDLSNLIKDSSYKASKEAFIKSLEASEKQDIDKETDFNNIKEKTADEFGKVFSSTFSKEISMDLAKLIMEFIKSADINIIYTPTTLLAGAIPVTGALTITPQTGMITIL